MPGFLTRSRYQAAPAPRVLLDQLYRGVAAQCRPRVWVVIRDKEDRLVTREAYRLDPPPAAPDGWVWVRSVTGNGTLSAPVRCVFETKEEADLGVLMMALAGETVPYGETTYGGWY